jgi:hypothetical protein
MKIHATNTDSHAGLFSTKEFCAKRERIALQLAQGMLANSECVPRKVVSASVCMAEEMIIFLLNNEGRSAKSASPQRTAGSEE